LNRWGNVSFSGRPGLHGVMYIHLSSLLQSMTVAFWMHSSWY